MENNTITVTIRNKIADIPPGDYAVSENTDLTIVFDFDSEWNAYGAKTAHFSMGGWEFETPVVNGAVSIPRLPSGIREMRVGVVSGDISTTTAAVIPVYDSILAAAQSTSLADAAEIARARAEAERVTRENERQANEAERIANEEERIAHENARLLSERDRNAAEISRASAELARASAENARNSAENARAAAETARAAAETARAGAESSRSNAETLREAHETARTAAENARNSAENARAAAESARNSAETARAAAESERQSAERARAAAETVRENSELARINAETSRTFAEAARVSAESDRAGAELDRAAAELERETQMSSFLSALNAYEEAHDAFVVPYLVNTFGAGEAFGKFVAANAPISGLTRATERFFTHAASVETDVYACEFTAAGSAGTKTHANSGLVCTPSTNASAGRDDYADLPLFACFDCNYTIDPTSLEPVIHAVKDVYGEFSSAPQTSLVGVIQMTGWVRRSSVNGTKKLEYAAYRYDAGFKPLPEAVRTDGTVRPYVLHAKYAAGLNSLGMLSSVSGVFCAAKRPGSLRNTPVSHDNSIALWRAWGSQYAGSGIDDQAFCRLMMEIKYAELCSSNIMRGCRGYDLHFPAAVSENGVKRILVLPAEGAQLVAGSTVALGSSFDRSSSASISVADLTVITSIEDVTVDGDALKAVNLDLASPINVMKEATSIITHPWRTGSTDAVKGNDGSPYNNLSGREPCKIQGIEIMIGAAEMLADTVANSSQGSYTVYMTRNAADIRTGLNGGTDPEMIGSITKNGERGAKFIRELSWGANDQEKYLLPTVLGDSSLSLYLDAQYHVASSLSSGSYSGWAAFGNMSSGEGAGFAGALLDRELDETDALITVRACGSGGSRGIYVSPDSR